MIQLHRFRNVLRLLSLLAALTIGVTLALAQPSSDHVIRQVILCCTTATVLLWVVVELTMYCNAPAAPTAVHVRTVSADTDNAARQSTRKTRFLAPEVRNRADTVSVASATETSSPFAGKTVLIADDDFEISQMLVMRFEQLGMTALRTSDAVQLLIGAHKVKANLVVLDVNMPTGNGLALCEMLNSDENLAGLPVIIYTGCSTDETIRRCKALGAHYVLKAPHSWPAIEKIVHDLFATGEPTAARPDLEKRGIESLLKPPAIAPAVVRASAPLVSPPVARPAASKQVIAIEDVSDRIFRVLAIHVEQELLDQLEQWSPALHMTVNSEPQLEQGYWACQSELPDVVIVGAQMTTSAAADVLRRLKSHPLCKHIPLLAIVGPDGQIHGASADGSLAEQFLRAPVNVDEATIALRSLFARVDRPVSPIRATKAVAAIVAEPADIPTAVESLAEAAAAEPPAMSSDESPASEPQVIGAPNPLPVPLADDAKAADDLKPANEAEPASASDDPHKARERPLVLVIDDDPDISAAIAMRLSTFGVDVLPSFAGMPGFWRAVDVRPDVILCDMKMPDGEGNYIAGRLQSHPLTQDIPVIIVTGQDSPGMKRVMMSMGVSAYLNKPIDMKELVRELRQHITLPESPHGPLAA